MQKENGSSPKKFVNDSRLVIDYRCWTNLKLNWDELNQLFLKPNFATINKFYLFSHFFRVLNTPMWTCFNYKIIDDTNPKAEVSHIFN